jgi:hypothetical protein
MCHIGLRQEGSEIRGGGAGSKESIGYVAIVTDDKSSSSLKSSGKKHIS